MMQPKATARVPSTPPYRPRLYHDYDENIPAFIVEAGVDAGLGGDPCGRFSLPGFTNPVYCLMSHFNSLLKMHIIIDSQRPRVAYKMKASPEVWMDAIRTDRGARASQERALCSGEGSGFGEIAQKSLVEHLHQFRAAGVIYFPQRGQE